MSGKKNDEDKPMMALLPFKSLEEIAKVLTFGASKYTAHNWREGFDWSRLESAILRHYSAYQRGEDLDPETGFPHLAHMATDCLFLLEHFLLKLGNDDRWPSQEKRHCQKNKSDNNQDAIQNTIQNVVQDAHPPEAGSHSPTPEPPPTCLTSADIKVILPESANCPCACHTFPDMICHCCVIAS
jgi:hypothetical protein